MNYTDRQGTDKKHRETGKKERKKEKNGDWNVVRCKTLIDNYEHHFTLSVFHFELKTYLFLKSFSP